MISRNHVGRNTAHRRKVGEALGFHGDVIKAKLRCHACQETQSEDIDASMTAREAVKDVTCGNCGRFGLMRMAKV